MCLPPATRTGGEIRKSPAKAESWSGQRLEAERNASAFSPFATKRRTCRRGRALVSLDQALYNKTAPVRGVEGEKALGLGGEAKRARTPLLRNARSRADDASFALPLFNGKERPKGNAVSPRDSCANSRLGIW